MIENKVERTFAPGDIVKHFKRETVDPNSSQYLYKIVTLATHTEKWRDVGDLSGVISAI